MKKHKFTYEKSGVNITAADNFVKFISKISRKNNKNIGGFGSISNIPQNFKKPKIVASTDGVGTKIEIANTLKKYDTIGIDLVAMCVNDLIVQGAKPLLFLDYISINKINLKKLKSIIKGIMKGCKISNCELVGGETAEKPGLYTKSNFDLAGFAIGLVHAQDVRPKNVKAGDHIIGIPSSGLHSNGFSLIRKLYNEYTEEMLTPTRIYTYDVLPIIEHINALAHITGGGIHGNLPRVLPIGTSYKLKFKYSKQWQELYKKT